MNFAPETNWNRLIQEGKAAKIKAILDKGEIRIRPVDLRNVCVENRQRFLAMLLDYVVNRPITDPNACVDSLDSASVIVDGFDEFLTWYQRAVTRGYGEWCATKPKSVFMLCRKFIEYIDIPSISNQVRLVWAAKLMTEPPLHVRNPTTISSLLLEHYAIDALLKSPPLTHPNHQQLPLPTLPLAASDKDGLRLFATALFAHSKQDVLMDHCCFNNTALDIVFATQNIPTLLAVFGQATTSVRNMRSANALLSFLKIPSVSIWLHHHRLDDNTQGVLFDIAKQDPFLLLVIHNIMQFPAAVINRDDDVRAFLFMYEEWMLLSYNKK